MTGATRESVNRALAELAAAGRVERRRGRYVIRPADAPDGKVLLPLGLEHRKGA